MNILYFSSFGNLRWGGQKSLYLLVTNLDRKRFRPLVVLPEVDEFSQGMQRAGIETFIVDLPKVALLTSFRALLAVNDLRKIILDHNIHILHTDGPRNTLYAGLAAKLTGRPLAWHIRASDHDPYDRLLYGFCDRIILVADALRKRFAWSSGRGKFITIYNGVPLPSANREAAREEIRKSYGIGNTLLLVQLSRIEPMKGQRQLIEACKTLKNHMDFKLLIVGEVTSDDYYRECRSAVSRYSLDNHVLFTGHQDRVTDFFTAADIVCLASSFGEAFPRSVIEGMAAGKPVVATDVGGTREAVLEGETGFIVPPGDIVALAEIISLLAKNSNLRQAMGMKARQLCAERFSITRNVRETETLYETLVNQRRP